MHVLPVARKNGVVSFRLLLNVLAKTNLQQILLSFMRKKLPM